MASMESKSKLFIPEAFLYQRRRSFVMPDPFSYHRPQSFFPQRKMKPVNSRSSLLFEEGSQGSSGWRSFFSKSVLIILNLITFVIGVILFVCGIVGQVKNNGGFLQQFYETYAKSWISIGSPLLLLCGIGIIVVSGLGLAGAVQEHTFTLILYGSIMSIIFIATIVGSILALVFRHKTADVISDAAANTLIDYDPTDPSKPATSFWDNVQVERQCCGYYGYEDWTRNVIYTGRIQVPATCCKDNTKISQCQTNTSTDTAWMDGCVSKTSNDVRDLSGVLGYTGLFAALLMVISILCAWLVATKKKGPDLVQHTYE